MDAAQALADLTEISSQVESAVLFDASGGSSASTLADEGRTRRLVEAARRLLEAAEEVRAGQGSEALAQLEAATLEGSVFIVRDGERLIVAATGADPTVGLVFYDLKSCLRSLDEGAAQAVEEKPKRRRRKAEEPEADAAP